MMSQVFVHMLVSLICAGNMHRSVEYSVMSSGHSDPSQEGVGQADKVVQCLI